MSGTEVTSKKRMVIYLFRFSLSLRSLSGAEVPSEEVIKKTTMKSGYLYILSCADNSYYTGSTTHLELRIQQHQNGIGANFTAKRLPVQLVYFEFFQNIADAFYREKQIQGWTRKKKEALIAGFSEELHHLAQCMNETHSKNKDDYSIK